jgi:hypothetical protein
MELDFYNLESFLIGFSIIIIIKSINLSLNNTIYSYLFIPSILYIFTKNIATTFILTLLYIILQKIDNRNPLSVKKKYHGMEVNTV